VVSCSVDPHFGGSPLAKLLRGLLRKVPARERDCRPCSARAYLHRPLESPSPLPAPVAINSGTIPAQV
jgi:hypothetical protein